MNEFDYFLKLGFTQVEIEHFIYLEQNEAKFTPNFLGQLGYGYEESRKLIYMHKIYNGEISIDTKEELIKHLKKMFGKQYKVSIRDLTISKIQVVPRLAVVSGISEEPYSIWNSKNHGNKKGIYKVIEVTSSRVTIETSIKPALKYGQAKEVPGVLEIKGTRSNGNAVVAFDKRVCKLCNRFIIVASLKYPEFHHGMFEIVCFEGTKVYVYATNMGVKDKVSYKMGNQRVYDYGLYPGDIKRKLERVAKALYDRLKGVYIEFEDATKEYRVIGEDTERESEEYSDELQDEYAQAEEEAGEQ